MARALKSFLPATLAMLLVFIGICRADLPPQSSPDYSLLLEYIALKDLQGPLVAFGAAEEEFDRRLNQENIDYLNTNKSLLEEIQSHLNGDSLSWRLGGSFKQLLVVPESRHDYARLFEQYCREAIDYLLARVHMPNPYQAITTYEDASRFPPSGRSKGVTAYLVHNIANEYIEEYRFFNEAEDVSEIRIKLSNREFDGRIGSYTSRLKIGENRRFEFIRESYTLWQNSADLPMNVFIVPIEETLHILLRPYTETAMQSNLVSTDPANLEQVQSIIDHWMAVEEAIVGGVVQKIMPDLMHHFVDGMPESLLTEAMSARDAHAQYVFLERGIQVVDHLGILDTMALYRQDPVRFRDLVVPQSSPVASVAHDLDALPAN